MTYTLPQPEIPRTQTALFHDRDRFFHRAVLAGGLFAAHVLVIVGLLALFAT